MKMTITELSKLFTCTIETVAVSEINFQGNANAVVPSGFG